MWTGPTWRCRYSAVTCAGCAGPSPASSPYGSLLPPTRRTGATAPAHWQGRGSTCSWTCSTPPSKVSSVGQGLGSVTGQLACLMQGCRCPLLCIPANTLARVLIWERGGQHPLLASRWSAQHSMVAKSISLPACLRWVISVPASRFDPSPTLALWHTSSSACLFPASVAVAVLPVRFAQDFGRCTQQKTRVWWRSGLPNRAVCAWMHRCARPQWLGSSLWR